jgi:hypothetical protein
MLEFETTPAIIADAARSKRPRIIILRRQTKLAFTGPFGLAVCAKCLLAAFLSIASVQRRRLPFRKLAAAFGLPLWSQMLLRKRHVGDRENTSLLSGSEVRVGSKAEVAAGLLHVRLHPAGHFTARSAGPPNAINLLLPPKTIASSFNHVIGASGHKRDQAL